MAAQVADGEAGGVTSDLAQLWKEAVEDYEKTTGQSTRSDRSDSMEDVVNAAKKLSMRFKDFRDDKSKISKVQIALENNMKLIQNIVTAVQNVANAASSAWPPALPATLIFTVFGQVVQSFVNVSAEYDKIMGLFEFTHRIFDRLSMIEQKVPKVLPFQRCVMRVFSSILKIFSVAQTEMVQGSDERIQWRTSRSHYTDGGGRAWDECGGHLATFKAVDTMEKVLQSMRGQTEFLVSNASIIEKQIAIVVKQNQEIVEVIKKSHLAIEFSHRIHEQSPETWVFWVYASNAARFEQSYREIADRAKIDGRQDPNANVFKLVCDWLQDAENGNWIVILDNVDDDDFLRTPMLLSSPNGTFKQPLKTYLPRGNHGLLIMTSRRRDVAMRIVSKRDIIAVNPMEKPQKHKAFVKMLGLVDVKYLIME